MGEELENFRTRPEIDDNITEIPTGIDRITDGYRYNYLECPKRCFTQRKKKNKLGNKIYLTIINIWSSILNNSLFRFDQMFKCL